MYALVYLACALAQAVLAVLAVRLFVRRPSVSAFMLILPIAAVVWDNTVIALGAGIGDGPLLQALSWPRFIGHALFTPAWIVAAVGFAQRAGRGQPGVQGLDTKVLNAGQWVVYAACVVLGLLRSVVFLVMKPVEEAGLFYYGNAGSFPGPPFGSITMLFVVLVFAVLVWRRIKSPWMFVGALVMLFAFAVPQAVPLEGMGHVLENAGEVAMAASLVYTERLLQKRGA